MVYDNVCYYARKKGLTIHQLELRANISNGVIAGWKKSTPSSATLLKVANVLHVSISTLLKDEKPCDN